MTEADLLSHIRDATGVPDSGGHPTYLDAGMPVHPTEPVDYDLERQSGVKEILGEADFDYHPALGCPHVDISRYPASPTRPFVCYLTSGMSDFPIRLRDGSANRVELLACTTKADQEPDINSPASITQVIRYVSLYPFIMQKGIAYYHVVELPEKYLSRWGKRILLIPPFLLKELAFLPLMGQRITVLAMIRISDADFDLLMRHGQPDPLFDSWEESLETWLFDTEERIPKIQAPPPAAASWLGRLLGRK